jgi:hypothetical protein
MRRRARRAPRATRRASELRVISSANSMHRIGNSVGKMQIVLAVDLDW